MASTCFLHSEIEFMNDPITPWTEHYAHSAAWTTVFEPQPLHEVFEKSAAVYADRPYLDFLGHVYSYAEIADRVDKAARGFQILGVKKGIKVGLFLPNCPQYVIAYFGILKAGGTVVNFSPLYSVPELIHQVEDSETDIMVCLDVANLYETINQVLEQSRLRCLIVGSLAEALPLGKSLLYRMFKRQEQARVAFNIRHIRFSALLDNDGKTKPVAIDPLNDIAVLQYTGGTTGTPKGAMLTHANLYINAHQVVSLDPEIKWGHEIMFAALPFFHVFANTVVLNASTIMGGMIAMLPKFEVTAALKLVARVKPTIMPGVPTMYTAILDYPKLDKFDLTSLRVCISGGAPMPVELKKRFEDISKSVVCEGYGLTESSGVVAVNPFRGVNKPGSIGQPVPGTTIIIVDKDDPHTEMALGQAGEICVRGPQIMKGYWQRSESTANVMVDGCLRTGDVGYLDADGYTFIIDRIKDMISVGGFKVFPRRVEDVLYSHPAVKEAVVIGIADPLMGERPKAFVVLKSDVSTGLDSAALLAYLKPQLGKHEMPVSVEFRASLPKTMIGKLSKKELIAEEKAKAS
jgi:long-chain acyl-CoA synthetase